MSKINLIIGREYLTRVKKKSFIVMTILAPILLVAVYSVPVIIAIQSAKKSKEKTAVIGVINESGFFNDVFVDNDQYKYTYLKGSVEDNKSRLEVEEYDYLLYIPSTEVAMPEKAVIYSNKKNNNVFEGFVRRSMKDNLEDIKMRASGIDPAIMASIKTNVLVETYVISKDGKEEKSYSGFTSALGIFGGMLIYIFIFLYGAQVMKGVMEEKSSRIVEVIMSSVKPFQLMMGKIIGIGLVGLTQFLLWIILTGGLIGVFSAVVTAGNAKHLKEKVAQSNKSQMSLDNTLSLDSGGISNLFTSDENTNFYDDDIVMDEVSEALNVIKTMNLPVLLINFLFYFIFGYLLYASLFAAIGGAVDNETDSQQFMLPVTIPLIAPIMMVSHIVNEPNSSLAVWMSMIPFTSPMTMMIRIPFGVPIWQVMLSMALLVGFIFLMTWMAAKIYRTGILMYGKKVTWKELWKWLRYN